MVMKIGPRQLVQLALLGAALLPVGMTRAQQLPSPAAGAGIGRVDRERDGKADEVQGVLRRLTHSDLQLGLVVGSDGEIGWSDPDTVGLGATLEQADRAVRAQLGLPNDRGLVVWSLAPDGPAARAGLQVNDILLTLDGKPLDRPRDFTARLKEAGDKAVPLALLRAGKPMTIQVKPEYRVTFTAVHPEKTEYSIGVSSKAIDGTLRAHLPALAEVRGLVVNGIAPDSPAARAGMKLSDILLAIGDAIVTDSDSLVARIQATGGKTVPVKILREGKPMTIEVTPTLKGQTPTRELALEAWELTVVPFNPLWVPSPHMTLGWDTWSKTRSPSNQPRSGSIADSERVEKRLDALGRELKGLQESIEALRKTLKPDGERK